MPPAIEINPDGSWYTACSRDTADALATLLLLAAMSPPRRRALPAATIFPRGMHMASGTGH